MFPKVGSVMTTFLVVHPWITTAALVACLVLGPIVGYLIVDRRRVALWLGLAGLVPVVALTLFPAHRDLEVGCTAEWAFPTLPAVELMANIVLFAPPVLLLGIATRRPIAVLMAASAVSVAIEATQAFIPALGRSCSTNDWLSNTLGAALGAAIALAVFGLRAIASRRRPTKG